MITKTIKYTDFNGVEREEKYLFNLTKAELMEMELGTTGGLAETIQNIVDAQDVPKIQELFKKLLLKSYGVKSEDGKRFMKIDKDGTPLSNEFSQSAAFSELYIELATDAEKATDFVKGIIPQDIETATSNNKSELKAFIENKK